MAKLKNNGPKLLSYFQYRSAGILNHMEMPMQGCDWLCYDYMGD